jgi:hypothetical protein
VIRPTEILNLGVGNYDTTQEVNLFLDRGARYQPDQVVLFYFINDAEPVPQKSRFPRLGHSRLITFYWSRLKALRARLAPGTGFAEYYAALDGAEGWARSQAALLELQQQSRARGFDLAVANEGDPHSLWVSLDDAHPNARAHRLIADYSLNFLAEAP